MTKQKLLLIRDNTYKMNWGCRATSIALSQLLSTSFDVSRLKPYHDINYKVEIGGGLTLSPIMRAIRQKSY